MNAITFDGKHFDVQEGETVLDALLREGQEASYSCKAGVCQSCLMVCEDGEIPAVAQKGLKDSQKALNYFLPCQCKPSADLSIASLDQAKLVVPGTIRSKSWLSEQVIKLQIETDLDFRAGQYITLWKGNEQGQYELGRSYSIASLPEEGFIECHLKVIENGVFSQWVNNDLEVGQTLGVQGPMGLCFYQGNRDQPLLLAAIGTGLAPILGILKDALDQEHSGQIDLVFGAKTVPGLYLLETLEELENTYENVTMHCLVQEGSVDDERMIEGDMYAYIKNQFTDLKDREVYLCGAESFVKKLKKQVFLGGTAMSAIHSDSFIAS